MTVPHQTRRVASKSVQESIFGESNSQLGNHHFVRGLAEHQNLSVASKSTKFDNCSIIRSASFFSYLNHSLAAEGSSSVLFTQERGCNYA